MALIRWSPFEEMELLRQQIDTVFEGNGTDSPKAFQPPVEVTETEMEYRVRLMLPGMDPDKMSIEATTKNLSVTGEFLPFERTENETIHLSQFKQGCFSRQFAFPAPVNQESIQAHYEKGILYIVLPKAKEALKKSIPIQVSPNEL